MPRPDLSMTTEAIQEFLRGPHVGVLSTIDHLGFPHAVGIYYSGALDEVSMWVYGKSQKVRNVERDPRCSLLVEAGEPYVDLKGVLLRGNARVERDRDRIFDLGRAIYDRYFYARTGIPFDQGPHERIAKQSEKRVNIVLTPARVASWDHAKSVTPTGGP
jgi:PPOX class probable F420-dependent enzyme